MPQARTQQQNQSKQGNKKPSKIARFFTYKYLSQLARASLTANVSASVSLVPASKGK